MSLRVLRLTLMRLLAPATVLVASGCSGSGKDAPAPEPARAADSADSPMADGDSAEQARVDSVLAALAACPRDGLWHACSVERRLAQSGLRPVLEPDSTRPIPGVSGPTTHWRLGRQQLWLVLFADSAAARDAMASMDSLRAAPRGDTTVVWPDRATLLRSANAVGVLLGGSDRTVERVTDALLAGPPQR
jgi:hypothetical protein